MKPLKMLALAGALVAQAHAQTGERLSLSVYGNTSSPLMVGVSGRVADRLSVRVAAGHWRSETTGRASSLPEPEPVRYHVNFVGASAAVLFKPLRAGLVEPYAGPSFQIVSGRRRYTTASPNEALPGSRWRGDAGVLVGADVNGPFGLGLFGEVNVGYGRGFRTNSVAGFERDARGFGLTNYGLGLKARLLR